MKQRITISMRKALVLLVLAALVLTAAFPAAAYTGERISRSRDFQKSELSPYSEDGVIDLTRSVRHTPSEDFSFVRVLITTGSVSAISFDLYGSYYIEQNNMPLNGTVSAPVSISVTVSGGNVAVSVGGNLAYRGTNVDVRRVTLAEEGGWATLHTSGNSTNNGRKYLGHICLKANTNGTVRFINEVPTAHYCYGVVPYEMNEGCNLEALRAQAITSRTFAFGFPYGDDDCNLTDSMTYQGYRGYTPGYEKCMQACLSTRGKILFYDNAAALTFYSSSNGGETALPGHAFNPSPLDDQYSIRIDDPDVQYGSVYVRTLPITYGQSVTNSAFYRLLTAEATSAVGHTVTVVSVLSADVNTPKYTGCARNMTKMDCTVRINDGGTERNLALRFDVTKLKSYGVFSGSYKIYWGKAVSGGYTVYFSRHGHGVGLAQYGAIGRGAEGWTGEQIVNFYFNRMQLLTVTENDPESEVVTVDEIAAYGVVNSNGTRMRTGPSTDYSIITQFSAGTHTDVITETDGWLLCLIGNYRGYIRADLVDILFFPAPPGAIQNVGSGVVRSGITDASLRSGPNTLCEELANVPPGTPLEVWHTLGSWYHVRYNGMFCFVHRSLVNVSSWTDVDLHGSARDFPKERP